MGIKFFFLFIIIRHHSGRRYALHRIRIYKYILSCLSKIHTYKKTLQYNQKRINIIHHNLRVCQ